MYGRAGFDLLKARVLPWISNTPLNLCTESAEDPIKVQRDSRPGDEMTESVRTRVSSLKL